MRIFRHYRDIPAAYRGAVVAVGNFDGVHRGHQALIAEAKRLARERGAPLAVLAFEPHPQEFFRPQAGNFRLTPFHAKARLIAAQGADALFALAFDAEMAAKSADAFVRDVLVGGLGVACVLVGADFLFGKDRQGDIARLAAMGAQEGFEVRIFEPVTELDGLKISSTRIRDALKAGRPDEAAQLLGHWWAIEAPVIHGDKRGRTIGVPTANMPLDHILRPAFGVYAVRATVFEGDKPVARHDGVANLGIRPMFATDTPLLETYLFGFDGDLYGKHLAVELISYLRAEAKFDGLEALKAQIVQDCAAARAALKAAIQHKLST